MFFLGLAGLWLGAELLVIGASRLGLVIGISPLVIGLTIVAVGTSSPEIAVSVQSALEGHPDIIIGTVIGSSIFNILFILGLSALITPLVVSRQLIWYDVPIMIGAHLLLFVICLTGKIDKINALILLTCMVAYTIFAIRKGREEAKVIDDEFEKIMPKKILGSKPLMISKQVGLVLVGLIFCTLGAGWLLDSALIFARALGMSELVIGITLIGASTSLPELATSLLATIRGQRDIAIGNVVGSNISNALGVIGIAGLFAPDGIAVPPSVLRLDLPVAIAACFACLPIFFTGHKISRWEGALFLGYYIIYTVDLVLIAKNYESLPIFNAIIIWLVVPLTLLTLAIFLYRKVFKENL